MTKNKCYDCVYRRSVAGSAHSSCAHPDTSDVRDNPMAEIVGIIGDGMPLPTKAWRTLKISGIPHGIRNGWFCWPLNFDPVWLNHCDGFKNKEIER